MLERAKAGRSRQAAFISLLLLGVKDDMGFVVAAFGCYLALRSGRRPYLGLVPLGLGMVALVNAVLLSPARSWPPPTVSARNC